MKLLDQLVALLDQPDDEAWGNVWVNEAAEILRGAHKLLLPEILTQWQDWPSHRQEHLAFILGLTGSLEERALINSMLKATDPKVRSRAQEALEEFEPRNHD